MSGPHVTVLSPGLRTLCGGTPVCLECNTCDVRLMEFTLNKKTLRGIFECENCLCEFEVTKEVKGDYENFKSFKRKVP